MAREQELSRQGKSGQAKGRGQMTVVEAGHLGGEAGGRKGGEATAATHGREFYQDIGKKGGETVAREAAAGKEALGKGKAAR